MFCDGETVLGHMEKVDEVLIVHDGDFVLVHYLRLPWYLSERNKSPVLNTVILTIKN